MWKRTSVLIGILVTASALAVGTVAPATASAAAPTQVTWEGVLQSAPASLTAPATLAITTANHGTVTVNLTNATRIVRRYNGLSSLDELSSGDVLWVTGIATGSTINASRVKDWTIQDAFTRSYDKVTNVSTSNGMLSVTVTVLRDVRHAGSNNPWHAGHSMTFTIAPTMVIALKNGTGGAASQLSTGNIIVVLGTASRHSRTFINVKHIRIVK